MLQGDFTLHFICCYPTQGPAIYLPDRPTCFEFEQTEINRTFSVYQEGNSLKILIIYCIIIYMMIFEGLSDVRSFFMELCRIVEVYRRFQRNVCLHRLFRKLRQEVLQVQHVTVSSTVFLQLFLSKCSYYPFNQVHILMSPTDPYDLTTQYSSQFFFFT